MITAFSRGLQDAEAVVGRVSSLERAGNLGIDYSVQPPEDSLLPAPVNTGMSGSLLADQTRGELPSIAVRPLGGVSLSKSNAKANVLAPNRVQWGVARLWPLCELPPWAVCDSTGY